MSLTMHRSSHDRTRPPDDGSQGASDELLEQLFARMREGDQSARDQLLNELYAQLRTMARRQLRGNQGSLNTTALVNEAYLKMFKNGCGNWEHRRHFLGTAAMAMRQVVTDYLRRRRAQKRHGMREPLDDFIDTHEARGADLLAIDEALEHLVTVDAELVKVVEMRLYAGYSVDDTARILGMPRRTVERRWQAANAWLKAHMKSDA